MKLGKIFNCLFLHRKFSINIIWQSKEILKNLFDDFSRLCCSQITKNLPSQGHPVYSSLSMQGKINQIKLQTTVTFLTGIPTKLNNIYLFVSG